MTQTAILVVSLWAAAGHGARPARSTPAAAVTPAPPPVPAIPTPPPAPPPEPEPVVESAPVLTGSYDNRFVLQIPAKKFSLQPILFVQPMFGVQRNSAYSEWYEGSGFSFRRAGVGLDARVDDWGRLFFVANLANGTLALWDFFIDVELAEDPGALVLRAGRFRPWLCRQRLVAADRFQIIQLPRVMSDFLDIGDARDLGAGVFGRTHNNVEYGFGVWNGEQNYQLTSSGKMGDRVLRGNLDFEVGGRIVYHPWGYLAATDESDLAYSTEPRLALGASAMYNSRHDQQLPDYDATAGLTDAQRRVYVDDRLLKAGVEGAFRYHGLSIEAEAFVRKDWLVGDGGVDGFNRLGVGDLARAAYVQAGHFLVPHKLEATGRFELVDVEPSRPGYMVHPTAGLNYFVHGYNLMLQVMYRANIGVGFDNYDDFWRSAKPALRFTSTSAVDRPLSMTTHELYLMLQASL